VEDAPAFTQRCVAEIGARYPNSEGWAADACRVKWAWAEAAAPMAETILALARIAGGAPPSVAAMQEAAGGVAWTAAGTGTLGDLTVTLNGDGTASFHWEEMGSEGRYNLIDALRIRGTDLATLGCPVYPGASMGQEKVMRAEVEGA
jgi:hypothetical protein